MRKEPTLGVGSFCVIRQIENLSTFPTLFPVMTMNNRGKGYSDKNFIVVF